MFVSNLFKVEDTWPPQVNKLFPERVKAMNINLGYVKTCNVNVSKFPQLWQHLYRGLLEEIHTLYGCILHWNNLNVLVHNVAHEASE